MLFCPGGDAELPAGDGDGDTGAPPAAAADDSPAAKAFEEAVSFAELNAKLYREQIEAFRRYQQLSAELVEVSQRLADLEADAQADAQAGGKKNSRR